MRSLGLRYSRGWIERRLREDEDPPTIATLVDQAAKFGVVVEAYRLDAEDLVDVEAPAILHLEDDAGGFAVWVGEAEGELRMAQAGGSPVAVSPSRLAAAWSGVTLLFERSEVAGEAERWFWPARIREWIEQDLCQRAQTVAGRGIGIGARIVGLGAVGCVVASQVVGEFLIAPVAGLRLLIGIALLSVTTWLSLVLWQVSRAGRSHGGIARRLCGGTGRRLDCDSVLHSRYASIGPWTLASLGIAGFGSTWCFLALVPLISMRPGIGAEWLGLLFLLLVPVAVGLSGVQVWPLRKLCGLCLGVHGSVVAGALVLGPGALAALPELGTEMVVRMGLIHGLLGLGMMGVGVPWLSLREQVAALRKGTAEATATPLGSLAITLARPRHLEENGKRAAMSWGETSAPVTIEAFVNPLCPSCGPVMNEVLSLARDFPDRVRVDIYVVPKQGSRAAGDMDLCVAVTVAVLASGREAGLETFWRIKEKAASWQRRAARGDHVLDELAVGDVEAVRDVAGSIVGGASQRVARIVAGLPIVLLGGYPFGGPVGHLRSLVDEHWTLVLESVESSE